MSKKPWIWPAWRSMVSTRLAPATVMRLATSLAEIGVRGPGFAVLAGVAEIGDDRGDAPGRGAPQRVDADQQLHQVVVGGVAGRLDDEDVLAADVLVDLDEHLHVGEAAHAGLGQRQVEIGGNRLGQRPIAVAGENFHAGHPDAAPSPRQGARTLSICHQAVNQTPPAKSDARNGCAAGSSGAATRAAKSIFPLEFSLRGKGLLIFWA